ncbi:MAG: hypothetical protein HY035_06870 [Nitrospirae bacterium]|nr:hypothetical protein [Nitrospirota bacterium]
MENKMPICFIKTARRACRLIMQMRYLMESHKKFNLPVLRFPLIDEEIKGLSLLRKALALLNL